MHPEKTWKNTKSPRILDEGTPLTSDAGARIHGAFDGSSEKGHLIVVDDDDDVRDRLACCCCCCFILVADAVSLAAVSATATAVAAHGSAGIVTGLSSSLVLLP